MPPKKEKEKELTPEQITKFQETFTMYDKKGEGTLTPKDLPNLMRACGLNPTNAEIQATIEDMDEELEGLINFETFSKMMLANIKDEDPEEKIREAFKVFDMEGNGFMEAAELREVMTSLGERLTEEEANDLIKEADNDNDGMVNYEEFIGTLLSV